MDILCPVCRGVLSAKNGALCCPQGHSFDIARQNYVNLLVVQQKRSLQPGDTRQQVLSRRAFLDGGFYRPIADAVIDMASRHGGSAPIVDIGCGEGYYTALLAGALDAPAVGIDISKEAVRCAAARYKSVQWLCASAAHLPLADGCAGLVTSLFSLTAAEEFHRILRPDGAFIQVLAAPDHLLGLKSVIYPELKSKPKQTQPEIPGFTRIESENLRFTFTVEGAQVENLLSMTPHVYRIGAEGAARLRALASLTDTASCVLNLYRAERS